MNIAVCEDNAEDSEVICGYIEKYCEKNCCISEIRRFESGESLLAEFAPGVFNVIFLDVYLTGMTGMETARKIRETDPECTLVFITVSQEHALDAFSVHADTYVLKPVDEDKMEDALSRCRWEFVKNSRFIEVKSSYQNLKIPLNDIQYVEVYNKYTLLHLNSGIVKTFAPLGKIEEGLGGEPFLRCHRSYIVNMNHVEDIKERSFLMRNGDSVPIRKNGGMKAKFAMARFMTEFACGVDFSNRRDAHM